MTFFIMVIVVALACSILSIQTLIGYGSLKLWYKITVALVVILGWFAPLWTNYLRKFPSLERIDPITYNAGYFLFGFVFILFSMLIVRDIAWYTAYGVSKITPLKLPNPKDFEVLFKANVAVIILSLVTSFYALYEGLKLPQLKHIDIQDSKIRKELKIAVIADLHVNRGKKAERVRKIVEKINAQNPDVVVLVGDVIDDTPTFMEEQLDELAKLSPSKGVYAILGNHEIYRGHILSTMKFRSLGFNMLINSGVSFPEYGVYLAGIPDFGAARIIKSDELDIDIEKTFKGVNERKYRILLSHHPILFDYVTDVMDLMISGHTHGGQIFPFHILVKKENRYLAGLYEKDGKKLFVSRGAAVWGPPMRLFAPADIAIIRLHP
jgi:hypothetical protein